MISFLESILKVFTEIGTYIVAAVVTFVNLMFKGSEIALNAALSILPTMPEAPGKLDSKLLEEINWFFPFAAIVSALTAGLVMYGVWLAVRWFLRVVRAA